MYRSAFLVLLVCVAVAAWTAPASADVQPVAAANGHVHLPGDGPHQEAEDRGWRNLLLAVYCLLIVGGSLLGGWLPSLVNLTHTRMQTLVSFVGGLMLGIGLLHLYPHAVLELGSVSLASIWTLLGILTMFFLIRAFHVHHHGPIELPDGLAMVGDTYQFRLQDSGHDHVHDHDHEHDHDHDHGHGRHRHSSEMSWLGITLGLSLHTLIDGIALGAHVAVDTGQDVTLSLYGLGTFLGVFLHKPLDAVSITSLMAAGGWSARARQMVNLGFAMMCPLGAVLFVLGVGTFSGYQHQTIGCALAFAAGVFLCISLGDLLPEMEFHSHNRLRLTVMLLLGVALAWAITFVEPEHLHGH